MRMKLEPKEVSIDELELRNVCIHETELVQLLVLEAVGVCSYLLDFLLL